MVRTRKRLYGEEQEKDFIIACSSQSSSNIAYTDRSRPKQFDQQEGKRQKKSKESSFFTFDMSNRNAELLGLLSIHHSTYVDLLEQVCNGQDQTMGKAKSKIFWRCFADRFCQKTRLENKEGMHIACQHYCDSLKSGYKSLKKTSGLYPVDGRSPEYCSQLTRIFNGCTPFTSTGRSSQSGGSSSSRLSGYVKKSELCDALAELAHSGDLEFDDIGRVEQYVTKCKTSLYTFMTGNKAYRLSVVHKYLGINSQETEVPQTPCDL